MNASFHSSRPQSVRVRGVCNPSVSAGRSWNFYGGSGYGKPSPSGTAATNVMNRTDSPDQHRASMLTFTLQQSILGKVALQQQQQ